MNGNITVFENISKEEDMLSLATSYTTYKLGKYNSPACCYYCLKSLIDSIDHTFLVGHTTIRPKPGSLATHFRQQACTKWHTVSCNMAAPTIAAQVNKVNFKSSCLDFTTRYINRSHS